MWNQRYAVEEYVYGKTPNQFVASVADKIPPGKVLCLGAGEGRNAVYLARQGYDVVAVDSSDIGLEKANRLVKEFGVSIKTFVADLNDFVIENDAWQGIVSIFCHTPPLLRKKIHQQVARGLGSDGVYIFEGYTPRQLEYKTGGPKNIELLATIDTLEKELNGLTFHIAQEIDREVNEGHFHHGMAAVAQILAIKT